MPCVYTEYTSCSVHNTLFLVSTRLRTPWLKIQLSGVESHGRSHAHFNLVFDVVAQHPVCPFPSLNSSPSASSSRVSMSFPNRTRSWCQSPSAPARRTKSAQMADSAPNTSYEPNLANFSSYMDPEHTPIDIPDSHQDFLCPDDATMIPTSPVGLPNPEAFSSSKQTTAVYRILKHSAAASNS